MKSTMNDKLKDKVAEADKSSCMEAVNDGMEWLDERSESADADDFEEKRKSVSDICDPIVAKVYESGDMGGEAGGDDSHEELWL